MKVKRKALVMALVCVMGLTLAAGTAQATWYTCSIQQAGFLNGGYYVLWLTDVNNVSATSTPFIITNANQTYVNAMYAAALTALSKGSNVYADLSPWSNGVWGTAYTVTSQ